MGDVAELANCVTTTALMQWGSQRHSKRGTAGRVLRAQYMMTCGSRAASAVPVLQRPVGPKVATSSTCVGVGT